MSVIKKLIVAAVLCCVFSNLTSMEVKVVEVSGKVEVQNGNKWVAVSKGDILSAGSVISTGFKSEAVLSFAETVIKVKALTRLTIEQLFEKDGDKASAVYLDTGSISADVKPAENKRVGFSVKTPAATASVRGTGGEVYSDGTVIGTSGKWCITAAEPRRIFDVVEETDVYSSQSSDSGEGEAGDAAGGASMEPPAGSQPESDSAILQEKSSSNDAWESFDFTYPDVYGAVYVSAGENVSVIGETFVSPMENKVIETTSSSGVQLLSETEKVVPVAPQTISEVGKPASSTVVVPEKPKFGSVEITITLPSVQSQSSNSPVTN